MKDKIKMILREGVVDEKIKRIAIFDFDGTLIDTDTPESGKTLWQQEFGFEWPFKGWWGRPESLDSRIYFEKNGSKLIEGLTKEFTADEIEKIIQKGLNKNIFDNAPITRTLAAYKEQSNRQDTLSILLTGRHTGVGNLVTDILNSKGLKFDDYIYKTGNLDTADFKIDVLTKLVSNNPDLKEMEIWEDREDHLPIFQAWGEQQPFKVIVHHITDATK
jgi:hypothetical protein